MTNFLKKIIPTSVFKFFQPAYHYLLALTGNIIYGFPGKKLICIGVTGTNGKSTTVELINSILKSAGHKTGMISTIAVEIAGERQSNTTGRTTLGRWGNPKLLRKMVDRGSKYAVIEVASEGIILFRTWGIPFDVAVFTNLSPEHLNNHKTMENYRNAKGQLFKNLSRGIKKDGISKTSVINADDKEASYFNSFSSDKKLNYGIEQGEIKAQNIKENLGLDFEISYSNKKYPISSKLPARFNVYNILAAWSVGEGLNIEPKARKIGIEKITQVEGRMEEIKNSLGIKIFVDYAMTPDSYEMLFHEMRKIGNGKLISVFGAAGERDRTKRPKIGKIAAEMADYIILTDDEPYNENPDQIISELEAGIKEKNFTNYKIERDRRKAIGLAVKEAKTGDIIVMPGMGHEKFRNVGGDKRIPWDDRQVIKEELNKLER